MFFVLSIEISVDIFNLMLFLDILITYFLVIYKILDSYYKYLLYILYCAASLYICLYIRHNVFDFLVSDM